MNNPFLIGKDNAIFSPHDELGFIVNNGDFVGNDAFIKRNVAINMLKSQSNMPIILNMGDSSTSGWHSDSLSRNGNNKSTAPYFHYKTYSDFMREKYPNTINAGISKYSSFQGAKYLALLLREFSQQDVYPTHVTMYFGNNDSVYSGIEDKTAIDGMQSSKENTVHRVSISDFKHNISEMIRLSHCYGARPVIIVPLRRYDWAPGLRSIKYSGEYEKGLQEIKSEKLRDELKKARDLYLEGKLEEAYEMDIFLPRIKERYVFTLRKIAKQQKADIIDLQKVSRSFQGPDFFCDYCHPIELANKLIFEEFLRMMNKKITRRKWNIFSSKNYSPDDIYPIW